jgi:hypothetical protein
MNRGSAEAAGAEASAISQWHALLRDDVALLAMPGAHHKALIKQAHTLHQNSVIDAGVLGELLELADAALAYAVEALLDIDTDE